MKNKGFTLIEVLLVIIIIGIIGVITFPGIMEALDKNKQEGAESLEKLLKHDLELYNIDNESDLWPDDSIANCAKVSLNTIKSSNEDIKMGDCRLIADDELIIAKGEGEGKYNYYVNMVCGKGLPDGDTITKESAASLKEKLYYKHTHDLSGCTFR